MLLLGPACLSLLILHLKESLGTSNVLTAFLRPIYLLLITLMASFMLI